MRDSAGVKPPWCTNPPPAPCTPGCEASEYTHRTVAAASISPNTRRVYLQKSLIKGGKETKYRGKRDLSRLSGYAVLLKGEKRPNIEAKETYSASQDMQPAGDALDPPVGV
jgi:hypothetical protein